MAWFNDERLEEIYYQGTTYGVLPEDCFLIRRKLVILKSAVGGCGLTAFGSVFPLPEGRRAIQVTPDWSISFVWFEGVGALAMRLEP